MNHTMARLRGAGALLLNLENMIDWLLDRLDELSTTMLPAQVELVPCRQTPRERRFD